MGHRASCKALTCPDALPPVPRSLFIVANSSTGHRCMTQKMPLASAVVQDRSCAEDKQAISPIQATLPFFCPSGVLGDFVRVTSALTPALSPGMCLARDESLGTHAFQPAVGTGDWKVALTRTLESVRYAKQIPAGTAALPSAVPVKNPNPDVNRGKNRADSKVV